MDNAFDDFEQDKTTTDLSELLDTLNLIGVDWDIEFINDEIHMYLVDMNGEAVTEFIFDADESFSNIVRA